ncbi:hypothetical protein HYW46_03020 [Candidatus Daviesbacteria bacterium]|nr:hypothetical protein [Candidatus Daviesbacteria bacterium]
MQTFEWKTDNLDEMAVRMAQIRKNQTEETEAINFNRDSNPLNGGEAGGATEGMWKYLKEAQGDNNKEKFMEANSTGAAIDRLREQKTEGKKEDSRTQWQKDQDMARELRNPNWRAEYEASRGFDRAEYLAALPVVQNGKTYHKDGRVWARQDWDALKEKHGQPKHYQGKEG